MNGDSLALIVAECSTIDFNYLTANHARNCCDFHPFIPELKPCFDDFSGSISMRTPVLAFQVTLFPNSGMCIGITNHHALGDANSIFSFMKTWAALNSKTLEDDIDRHEVAAALVSESLPFYDRTMIKDTKRLGSIIWDRFKSSWKVENSNYTDSTKTLLTKTDKVRKTFVINRNTIEKLKNLALQKRQNLVHLSSFTVICAYVWVCLLKCNGPSGERADEEEMEHFICLADCRGRLDPPLPANYFGNCLTSCRTKEKTAKLIGEEGFAIAVELIGEAIHQRLKDKDALFNTSETETKEFESLNWDRVVTVAGLPRFNYYDLDFGWGKPIKFEFVSSDTDTGGISLAGGRESDGGVEVGLSLPKPKMDAFTTIFNDGLNAL